MPRWRFDNSGLIGTFRFSPAPVEDKDQQREVVRTLHSGRLWAALAAALYGQSLFFMAIIMNPLPCVTSQSSGIWCRVPHRPRCRLWLWLSAALLIVNRAQRSTHVHGVKILFLLSSFLNVLFYCFLIIILFLLFWTIFSCCNYANLPSVG